MDSKTTTTYVPTTIYVGTYWYQYIFADRNQFYRERKVNYRARAGFDQHLRAETKTIPI